MVQHVFIVQGLDGNPTAMPPIVNIWRDDQSITWKINLPNIGWDNEIEAGPNRAIQFDPQGVPGWEGSMPAPVGMMPIGLDQRLYTATGPGPNNGNSVVTFAYLMFVVDDQGNHRQIKVLSETQEIIDPDIGNQPQP